MLMRLNQAAYLLSWLDEAVEHCADNFLDGPLGLSQCFHTSMIPSFPRWCCWPAQFLDSLQLNLAEIDRFGNAGWPVPLFCCTWEDLGMAGS